MTPNLAASIAAAILFMAGGFGIGHLWTRRRERERFANLMRAHVRASEAMRRQAFLERCEREGRDTSGLRKLFLETSLDSQMLCAPLPPKLDGADDGSN